MDGTLTTEEAARIAGVTATTIKRWADEVGLPCLRTAGGHRRFRAEDLHAFLERSREVPPFMPAPIDADGWIRIWRSANGAAIDAALMTARSALGNWYGVADAVGAAVTEVGHRWADQRLSIADEHVATAALLRSLGRVTHSLLIAPNAPLCALATPDDEQHVLGLALAELTLREAGWNSVWLGASTPADELARLIAAGRVQLVALSASSHLTDAKSLERYAAEVQRACRRMKVELVVGGRAPWPERSQRMDGFDELSVFARAALPVAGVNGRPR